MNTGKSQAGIPQDLTAARLQQLHDATLHLLALLASHRLEKDLLQNGIDALTSLIEARYGAIGLTDETGKLVQFIHSGITSKQASLIGSLPEGHGILGLVIREGHSLRLDDISKDPRSLGFPPNHPPMKSLLAVPIAHEGRLFGQIYLSDKYDGVPFHDNDEVLTRNYANALALILSYHRSRVEQNHNEESLRKISEILSSASEEAFFSRLVLGLSQTLGVDYAFVGSAQGNPPCSAHTLAFSDHGRIVDNIDYPLSPDTACGNVECKTVCHFPDAAHRLFPKDEVISRYGVEAFIGHPLLDSAGNVIGLLVVMNGKPIVDKNRIQAVLEICASRVAAELERRPKEMQRQQLSSAIEQTADSVMITDRHGIIEYVNPAYEQITGFSHEEALGKTPSLVKSGKHEPAFYEQVWKTILDGRAFQGLFINRRKNGELYYEQKTITPLKDTHGHITHFVSTGKNITPHIQAIEALRASEAGLAQAQRIAHLGNWDWNIATGELHWSDEIYRILGLAPQQSVVTYETFLNSVHPEDKALVAGAVTRALTERQPYHVDHRILLPDGTERIVHEQGEVTFDESGKPLRMVGITQDITENKRADERLHYLAHYDILTGLPNRVLLHDRLNQAMIEADRQDHMVAIMFIDLDRFKIINDTLGHDTGDRLLKQVAERLLGCLRQGDTISRLGGDEFTVILTRVGHVDDVTHAAQKIIASFDPPFRMGEREMFMSPSIGITLYPFDDTTPENLLRNADAAMYHAKEMGRNTFRFYTAELNRRAAKRLATETALRHALERDEFLLHYQPQVDLKTGRVTGMEALIRWRHPEMGLVPPLEFIPLAEETGLIVPIGEWVLHTACTQAKRWHQAGFRHLKMAVNLSGRQFQQKNLVDQVKSALKKTGLPARCLDLELTESLLMHNTGQTLTAMKKLSKLGVDFSMDDFGTGYSSLSYLKRFPIDTLKIDRAFVRDITTDPDDAAIAQAIIAMSHSLGVHVIAEGVETAKQLAFLRANRCDAMQGYYFSKPIPAEDMNRLLLKNRAARLSSKAAGVRGKKRPAS